MKPEANPSAKPVSPAGEIRALKQQKLVKPAKKEVGVNPTAEKPATASKSDPRPNGEAAADGAEATVGEPLAPGMIEILQQEIRNAVRTRGVDDNFARFQRYSGYKLDSSAAAYTGSELAGNCRLSWYDHMLRHPLGAVAEAEQFTRDVHTAVLKDRGGLARLLPIIAEKLDLPKHDARKYAKVKTPQEALDVVKQALIEARAAQAAALAPLTKGEIRELSSYIYPVMVGQNRVAHTLNDRGTGRRLVDLMEKMDRGAMVDAAEALVPLTDPDVLDQLKNYPDSGDVYVAGVSGHVVAKIETPAGAIIIGGKEANTYDLDSLGDVALVIDLGGENTYHDGTVSIERPLLVNVNLGGRNVYRSAKPAVQGGAILGVSMIVNTEGGNRYDANDLAQASTIGGVGIIVEFGGDNSYRGVRRVQAQAIGGLGIIISHGGGNNYHAGMWGQGLGGPLGFGILDDIQGHDHYYLGGLYTNSYKPETPGYEGFGQGVGGGIRQVADGGIGMLLNGGGHNVYEFDYLSHGGGYWCGLGFARDFGGYSQRLIARKNYYGGDRTESLFQRFGCGWGCHYAQGFCFDDKGHSTFEGSIMGSGMGWDCSRRGLVRLRRRQPLRGRQQPGPRLRRPGKRRHPLSVRRRLRVQGLRPGLRIVEPDLPQPQRLRRQLQLPGQLRLGQHVRLRRPGALDHPARHFRRIPHQPAPPRSGHADCQAAQRKNHGRAVRAIPVPSPFGRREFSVRNEENGGTRFTRSTLRLPLSHPVASDHASHGARRERGVFRA